MSRGGKGVNFRTLPVTCVVGYVDIAMLTAAIVSKCVQVCLIPIELGGISAHVIHLKFQK